MKSRRLVTWTIFTLIVVGAFLVLRLSGPERVADSNALQSGGDSAGTQRPNDSLSTRTAFWHSAISKY